VRVQLPKGTSARQLNVDIKKTSLLVGFKGQPPIINGPLHKEVKSDDCFWTVEDQEVLVINLQKFKSQNWWICVIEGDPTIKYDKIIPEAGNISDLDGEARSAVHKMMIEQEQKRLGIPTSEELKHQELMKKFQAAHPEMDFSNAKMS